jgi:hypothetical protein
MDKKKKEEMKAIILGLTSQANIILSKVDPENPDPLDTELILVWHSRFRPWAVSLKSAFPKTEAGKMASDLVEKHVVGVFDLMKAVAVAISKEKNAAEKRNIRFDMAEQIKKMLSTLDDIFVWLQGKRNLYGFS